MVLAVNDVVNIASNKSKYFGYKAIVKELESPAYKTFTSPLIPNYFNMVLVEIMDSNNDIIKNQRFSINSLELDHRDTTNYDKFVDGAIVVNESVENSSIELGDYSEEARARKYGKIIDTEFGRDEDDGYRCIQLLTSYNSSRDCQKYDHALVHVNELRIVNEEEFKEYERFVSDINKRNALYIVMYDKIVRKDSRQRFDPRAFHIGHIYEQNRNDYDIEQHYFKINGGKLEECIKDMFNNEEVVSNSIEVYELGAKKKLQFSVEV